MYTMHGMHMQMCVQQSWIARYCGFLLSVANGFRPWIAPANAEDSASPAMFYLFCALEAARICASYSSDK